MTSLGSYKRTFSPRRLTKLTPPSAQPTLAYGGHQKMRFAAGAVREGAGGSIEDFTLKIWPL